MNILKLDFTNDKEEFYELLIKTIGIETLANQLSSQTAFFLAPLFKKCIIEKNLEVLKEILQTWGLVETNQKGVNNYESAI